jgi:hypothetical protein
VSWHHHGDPFRNTGANHIPDRSLSDLVAYRKNPVKVMPVGLNFGTNSKFDLEGTVIWTIIEKTCPSVDSYEFYCFSFNVVMRKTGYGFSRIGPQLLAFYRNLLNLRLLNG